jgi:O-methyltransferase
MNPSLKTAIKSTFSVLGLEVRRTTRTKAAIPDGEFYAPLFSPWKGYGDFARYLELARPYSLVTPDRLYILYSLAQNAVHLQGDFWECGVYRGGTARMFAEFLVRNGRPGVKLHLFDTFEGMPETDPQFDLHKRGDFSDTSLAAVKEAVGNRGCVDFHPGWVPDTFQDMPNERIALAHVDVDIYQSVLDCCEFIYPRLEAGGAIIFDDYGFPSCPGARKAVDEFFSDKMEAPIVLPTGQALAIRMGINETNGSCVTRRTLESRAII